MATKIVRPLHNESDYDAALAEIEHLFDKPPKRGTPEADRYELLALVIEDYEERRWPIEPPEPVDAILYSMEIQGLSQADLGRLLGSRQRASDILSGKRSLTMGMAWKLHTEWGIPAESLIKPPVVSPETRSQRHRKAA